VISWSASVRNGWKPFSIDDGAENFTWPNGGQTPFAGGKGTGLEGGFRVPCIIRWPGKVPAGKIENGIVSGLDWFPTFVAAVAVALILSALCFNGFTLVSLDDNGGDSNP
jgi:arylsulfatase A-like enzyme